MPRPLVRKKLWIFDFDNTLVRLEPEVDWAAARHELEPMLREAAVPEDLFEAYPRGNLPLYSAIHSRLFRPTTDAPDDFTPTQVRTILRRASTLIERYELAGVERAAPLEGAIQLLRQIRSNGASIAIATSNSSRTIRRWFSSRRLLGLIEAIVGRDSLLPLKPSPEMLARVLELCDVRAKDAAFAGDADSDYRAATALNLDFFGIAANQTSRDKLTAVGATPIFSSPAALGIHLNL
jgi:HAD superfamily hydrolase (TIGR01549 family)